MFQPGLAFILAEHIKYCEALRHDGSATTIEDGRKVKVQSTSGESCRKNDKCWIENECMCTRDVKKEIIFLKK